MKRPIVGYVVRGPDGVKCLGDRCKDISEAERLLWYGDGVTMFSTYSQARNAIRRTFRYATKENLNMEIWGRMFIWPVRKA